MRGLIEEFLYGDVESGADRVSDPKFPDGAIGPYSIPDFLARQVRLCCKDGFDFLGDRSPSLLRFGARFRLRLAPVLFVTLVLEYIPPKKVSELGPPWRAMEPCPLISFRLSARFLRGTAAYQQDCQGDRCE